MSYIAIPENLPCSDYCLIITLSRISRGYRLVCVEKTSIFKNFFKTIFLNNQKFFKKISSTKKMKQNVKIKF